MHAPRPAMPGTAIAVIGASAGGLAPLRTLVGQLSAGLPASVFVVVHIPPESPSALPQLLSRAGPLPAVSATPGAEIVPGQIYVARPDHHLIVTQAGIQTPRGARENGSRPAIDPLFRSAAEAFGPQVVGVILSGARTDGALGLTRVKECGGKALVQDPEEAIHRGMPDAALEAVKPDFVGSATHLGRSLGELLASASAGPSCWPRPPPASPLTAAASPTIDRETSIGVPSGFSCPDCHGVLWAMPGRMPRFRCRTGHDFSGGALLAAQKSQQEAALWAALRRAEECAELARRLEAEAKQRGHRHSARDFAESAARAEAQARAISAALGRQSSGLPSPVESDRAEGER